MRPRPSAAASLWWWLLPWLLGIAGCSGGRSPPLSTTPPTATYHTVRQGETLAAIGRLYGVSWQTLARLNGLADPHALEVGQSLRIPGRAAPTPASSPSPATAARFAPETALQWPATGVLSSGFGWRGRRFHGGIDISAERGTPIGAAAAGLVIFSGRGPDGYGNLVMLDHGSHVITLYAHNDRNLVRPGERVRRGQTIALMGDSGRASGCHLHFEVHQDGRLVDPLRWLR
jgi:murein DD-endopeptidase MepM/ murein hydrolase activator NlpD